MLQSFADWWDFFLHFLSLSLLAIGGAITTAPDMHRYLVNDKHWLTPVQFNSAIALAQAAPGPNVIFIAVLGWLVGLNSAVYQGNTELEKWAIAFAGALVCMAATLLPSSLLTYQATRWAHDNRNRRSVKAFKQGLVPIVIALLFSTAWLMSTTDISRNSLASLAVWREHWLLWGLTVASALVVWRTHIHLLWLLAIGGTLGALGWV